MTLPLGSSRLPARGGLPARLDDAIERAQNRALRGQHPDGYWQAPLAGDPATGEASVFYPCRNAAASSRVYTVDPRDHLRADRDAEDRGMEIVGVVHSHTHTEAYPSPTDVAQAPDPSWRYLIVSLKREAPETRAYRIVDGEISEEALDVV